MARTLPRFLIGIAAFAMPIAPATAQAVANAVAISPGATLLTITAEGKSTKVPDIALFSAGVTTQAKTASEALAQNSRAMEKVMAALKKQGVAERDIQTSNLSINPIYSDPNRDAMLAAQAGGRPFDPLPPELNIPRIVGYQANNTVSVRQRDLADYGKVIDTLANAGANQINGPNFQLDAPEPALDEARRAAMAQARKRAQLYADAAGLRIVRILSISESGGYYGPPPVMFARDVAASAAAPAPFQPGEMQLSASVTLQYELAP